MLKVIGGEQEGEFKAVASGTLPNGKPVIVNADGTVSVIGADSDAAPTIGAQANFHDWTYTNYISGIYDPDTNRVIVSYSGQSLYGNTVVGTLSGSTITFGTPVVFASAATEYIDMCYDTINDKVVIAYQDGGNTSRGTTIVGTVSGTSISFGTEQTFSGSFNSVFYIRCVFDENAQKVLIAYTRDGLAGCAKSGTVSGTSMSFGSEHEWEPASGGSEFRVLDLTYDTNAQKSLLAYRDQGNSNQGTGLVLSISGTTVSSGAQTVFETGSVTDAGNVYNSVTQSHLVAYKDGSDGSKLKAVVGTISGTTVSFGSITELYSSATSYISSVYNSTTGRQITFFEDNGTGNLKSVETTISGTSVSGGTVRTVAATDTRYATSMIDTSTNTAVALYRDMTAAGTPGVYRTYFANNSNLTAENYIGMSPGEVEVGSSSLGSITTFSAGNSPREAAVFDSNSNKVVIAYRDGTNSSYATAVVATVSGETISFGTPVVFNSGSMADAGMAFDSDTNQIIIATYDTLNLNAGTAWVGSVSGTSITFGTKVVYNVGNATVSNKVVYDTANQKVVIAYKDQAQSNYGKAIVGTVSGTSISFGTEVTFNANTTDELAMTYDSSNNKVVLVYQDTGGNSGYGTTIIGTVSGTSISFGTPVVHNASNSPDNAVTFDSINNKVVVGYEVTSTGTYAKVGTVSGTTISYGSAVNFGNSTDWRWASAVFDVNAESVVFAYGDPSNSNNGKIISGAVSGSTITFQPEQTFLSATLNYTGAAYDSLNKKVVVAFQDRTDNYGKAIVSTTAYEKRFPVADGSNVKVNIIGSVSTNQSGLTAGEKYYVQTDGTISTTAGSPSVLAGTAISATKLVVKT